jgi:hypothetical protein
MIKNIDRYRRRSERQRWKALQEMSPEESIALGEALLTSEIMALADFRRRRRPKSLAASLGIRAKLRAAPR